MQLPSIQTLAVAYGALIGVLALVLILAKATAPAQTLSTRDLPPVSRKGYTPRGPLFIPLTLGQVTYDLQPRLGGSLHVGVGGTTGLGKSTCVTSLFDLDIGVLAIALDHPRPLRKKVAAVGGIDWTNDPRQCSIGLDLLNASTAWATAELVVSGLPKVQGDSGQWRRAAIARIAKTIDLCDRKGIERNWPDLIRALWLKTGDVPADRACNEWASKLEQIHMLFGASFGADLNLVEAMRQRQKVVCWTNHFLSPENAPLIGGWLMVLARLVATEAGIPFVLIVEEANQAEVFAKYITPIAQAARDRDVVGVWIGQNLSKLPDEVLNNTKVWVCFGQELEKEQQFAAQMLRLDKSQLGVDAFPKARNPIDQGVGWCYVRAPGLPTTLVHLRNPMLPKRDLSPSVVGSSFVGTPDRQGVVVVEATERRVNGWRPWIPRLPEPSTPKETIPAWLGNDKQYVRMWEQCRRTGIASILWSPSRGVFYDAKGCLEWTGTVTRPQNGAPARPRSSYRRKHATPYREFYRLYYGVEPDPTVDHLCGNPMCCDVLHLELCSIGENNLRDGQREKIFSLAGWHKESRLHLGQRVARWVGEVPLAA